MESGGGGEREKERERGSKRRGHGGGVKGEQAMEGEKNARERAARGVAMEE